MYRLRAVCFAMSTALAWVFLLLTVAFPTPALSQWHAMSLKMGYADFQFEETAQVFGTPDGGAVRSVRSAFSGTTGIGFEMMQAFGNGHFMLSIGADYRSANLFGSGGSFTMQYAPEEHISVPVWDTRPEVKVKDLTSYFRTTISVGLSPIRDNAVFVFLAPNIDMQYGQKVYMEQAYQEFLRKGYSEPGDFAVDRSLTVGGGARLHVGMWLGNFGLMFSPGVSWSYRFDERFSGYTHLGVTPRGWSFAYDFSFGLLSKLPSSDDPGSTSPF